ncbi:hypothetical protein [Rhodobium gokarnense]|uniref:Uncharacterized protein n=1 Tax=Rhodobium gokarnense TaxID=364296 RepID=A0ABT3HC58_9HYPH|nr:hypothetical protein [Rhodobium gokarnense]MCW2307983.1 hypothetical protein [Rhodobium gokarnense]
MKRKRLKWNFLISIAFGAIAILIYTVGRNLPMAKYIFNVSGFLAGVFLFIFTIFPIPATLAFNMFKSGERERKAMERPPVSWFLLREDE